MRVISMVPSWTETLLACDIDVVGRTRYCIHPQPRVKEIAVVGGTKDIDVEACRALRPDLMILDREENPLTFLEQAPCPIFDTHVTSIASAARDTARLAEVLGNAKLAQQAERWGHIEAKPVRELTAWAQLAGVKEWWRPAGRQTKAVYLIWREPWMSASASTFIGSVLQKIGVREFWPDQPERSYPVFAFQDIADDTVLLCSSEPFPFALAKFREEILASGKAAALLDGESFSWFGLRSLEFLEQALKALHNS